MTPEQPCRELCLEHDEHVRLSVARYVALTEAERLVAETGRMLVTASQEREAAEQRIDHLLVCKCPSRPNCRPQGDDGVHQWIDLCEQPHEHSPAIVSRAAREPRP